MDPVLPDYGGEAITSLVPALVGGRPAPYLPPCVAGADAVVMLLFDGLGWQAVEAHRSLLPELAGLEGKPITTVAPSTQAGIPAAGRPPTRAGIKLVIALPP